MNKQITVSSHNGVLLINEEEWIADTDNNMKESQKHYFSWKKRVYKVWFHLCEDLERTQLIYDDKNQKMVA